MPTGRRRFARTPAPCSRHVRTIPESLPCRRARCAQWLDSPPTPDLDGNPSHLDPADTAVLDQQADFLRFIGTHWTNSSASNPSIRRHIARRQLAWRFDQNGKAKLQSSPYPILDLRRLVPATDPIKLTIPFRLRGWGGTNTAQISLSGPDDAALVSVALMLKDTSVDGSYAVGLGPRNRCRTPSCRRPAQTTA